MLLLDYLLDATEVHNCNPRRKSFISPSQQLEHAVQRSAVKRQIGVAEQADMLKAVISQGPSSCRLTFTTALPHSRCRLNCTIFMLYTSEAHGCIKQRSVFLIAQGAGRAARISFLATTHKHAPLMRPQGHDLPMCFASKQLLTTGEPQLLLFLLCL